MAALTSSSRSTISKRDPNIASANTIVPMDASCIDQLIENSKNRIKGTTGLIDDRLETIEKMLSQREHASGRDFCRRLALGISELHHPDSKLKALNLFIRFLLEDPLTPETSVGLVDIAEKLMLLIDPSTATTNHNNSFLEKYLECYALVIEMILVHYGKGHIPSLQENFKTQLAAAETKIKALCENQQIPAILHACALIYEGLKRVKTDQKDSSEIVTRLKNLTNAVKQVADTNLTGALTSLAATVEGLNKYLKAEWYKKWLICMALAREVSPRAPENPASNLIKILQHTVKKHIDSDWHFTYGAIQILGRVASQQASTPALRKMILLGEQPKASTSAPQNMIILDEQPSLVSCLQFNRFKKSIRKISKEEAARHNLMILQVAVTALKNFLEMRSEDRDTCLAVKAHLMRLRLQEKDAKEMSACLTFIPKDPPAMLKWLNDSAPIVAVAEPLTPTREEVEEKEMEEKQKVEKSDENSTFDDEEVTKISYAYSSFNDKVFAKIVIHPNITHLNLKNCTHITDKSLERLTRLTNLRHLNLACTNITGTGFKSLPPTLRSLNLSKTKLNTESLLSLQNLPLENLKLDKAFPKHDPLKKQHSSAILDPLTKINSLLSLNLFQVCADLASIRSLTGLKLHTLVVSGDGITDAVIECISDMPLKKLYISFAKITNGCLAHLQNKQITVLSLRNTRISSLERLAGLPLTTLDISETPITDSELEYLTKMSLVDLHLYGCEKLTDDAITRIARIKTLQKLDISATPIRFTGSVIRLLKTMNLRSINVSEAQLVQTTLSRLQSALPKCEIRTT